MNEQALDECVADADAAVARLCTFPCMSVRSMMAACESFEFLNPSLRDVLHAIGQVGCWLFVDLRPGSGRETIPEAVRIAYRLTEGAELPYNSSNVAKIYETLRAAKLPGPDILDIALVIKEMHRWASAVGRYFLLSFDIDITAIHAGSPSINLNSTTTQFRVKRMEKGDHSKRSPHHDFQLDRTALEQTIDEVSMSGSPVAPASQMGSKLKAKPILRGSGRSGGTGAEGEERGFQLDRSRPMSPPVIPDILSAKSSYSSTIRDGSPQRNRSVLIESAQRPPLRPTTPGVDRSATEIIGSIPLMDRHGSPVSSPMRSRTRTPVHAATYDPTTSPRRAVRGVDTTQSTNIMKGEISKRQYEDATSNTWRVNSKASSSSSSIPEIEIMKAHLQRHYPNLLSSMTTESPPDFTKRAMLEPMRETLLQRAIDDVRANKTSSVVLRDCGLKAPSVIQLCNALQNCKSVTHVDLTHNDLGIDGAKELIYCLRNGAPNLRRIEIHNTLIPDDIVSRIHRLCEERSEANVVSQIVEDLKEDSLRDIDLSYRCLGDASVIEIIRAATKTKNLRSINFNGNNVTAVGARAAVNLMADDQPHGIHTLLLDHNPDVPAGALQRLKALCALRLSGTWGARPNSAPGFGVDRSQSNGSPKYESNHNSTWSPPRVRSAKSPDLNSSCPLKRVASFAILKVRQQLGFSEEELRRLFDELDPLRNGYVEKSEFRKMYLMLENFGVPQSSESVDDMLSKYNMIGPLRLSFDEFAIIMLKVAQR
eukprot:PhF_6_TR1043/c0_g1_i1/m.2143